MAEKSKKEQEQQIIDEIMELLYPDPWAVAEARDNARHAEKEAKEE